MQEYNQSFNPGEFDSSYATGRLTLNRYISRTFGWYADTLDPLFQSAARQEPEEEGGSVETEEPETSLAPTPTPAEPESSPEASAGAEPQASGEIDPESSPALG